MGQIRVAVAVAAGFFIGIPGVPLLLYGLAILYRKANESVRFK